MISSFHIVNPPFNSISYAVVVADLNEKHDRSAPSDYHWKILKCRMLIFSNVTILSCPDEGDVKKIHVIFNNNKHDYDYLKSLFTKFSLTQEGDARTITKTIYGRCFQYTMLAKMAPTWNLIGANYLVNNRNFLTTFCSQDGVHFNINATEDKTVIQLKAIRVTLFRARGEICAGQFIRVLPSLNKAVVEELCNELPPDSKFKTYKNLKRHWKNIHGYRLPEEESPYCLIKFWRGEPLTYPQLCVTRQLPIIVPVPKQEARNIILRFINLLKKNMLILGMPIQITDGSDILGSNDISTSTSRLSTDTQAITLCTPTQQTNTKHNN